MNYWGTNSDRIFVECGPGSPQLFTAQDVSSCSWPSGSWPSNSGTSCRVNGSDFRKQDPSNPNRDSPWQLNSRWRIRKWTSHSMVTEIGPWFPWFFSSQKIVKYANVMPPKGTGCLVSCRVWISVDEGPKVGRGLGCEPLRMACRSCWWHGPKPTRNGVMKRGEIPQEWRLEWENHLWISKEYFINLSQP